MRILLTGRTGGIGSAIAEALHEHEVIRSDRNKGLKVAAYDWAIFAHGFIGENNVWQTFLANVMFHIETTQVLLPNTESFIFISSTAGISGNTAFPAYAASKAALNNFVLSMAKGHPRKQFYAICPGPTNTKMWRDLGLPGEAQEPSEVAKVVRLAIEGAFESGDIITVRNGVVSV